MESSAAYLSYVNDMKNYQTTQGRKDSQAPYTQAFETIYNKAKEEDVKLSNAKSFLDNLSQSELKTLQKYAGLAESIDLEGLSSEGAYNLLMHDYEQYDFNDDGVAEVGEAQRILAVAKTMPQDVRVAYIEAMNSMSDKDKLLSMMLTLDPARITARINNEPYTPTTIDYQFLKQRVDSILNPTGGAYSSEETKQSIQNFWDAFNNAYDSSDTNSTEEQTSSEVAQFLKDLREKGALKFLADLNQEKIDKMVAKYKQKLIDEMGDSPEMMAQIDKLVEDFRKKLLEDMQNSLDNTKDTTPINSPFEKLLQS